MSRQADPVQVYENHSGPIPKQDDGGHIYAFVAYRDAEADVGQYGYGHTEEDAITDYMNQQFEDMCVNCERDNCSESNDCILTNGWAARFVRKEIEAYHDSQSNTHSVWRELNDVQF